MPYPEVAFDVKVTLDSTYNDRWKNYISVTHGSLSGYSVKYYISQNGSNDSSAETKTGYNSGSATSISGKVSGKTYYVWATATKSGKTFKSTNYLKITLGHKHTSQTRSSTSCYGNEREYCDNGNEGYYLATTSSNWEGRSPKIWSATASTENEPHACVACCTWIYGKYGDFKGDPYYSVGYVTVVCRACRWLYNNDCFPEFV